MVGITQSGKCFPYLCNDDRAIVMVFSIFPACLNNCELDFFKTSVLPVGLDGPYCAFHQFASLLWAYIPDLKPCVLQEHMVCIIPQGREELQ